MNHSVDAYYATLVGILKDSSHPIFKATNK